MLHEEGYGGLSENKYISIGRQVLFSPLNCVKLHDGEALSMSGIQPVVINNQLNRWKREIRMKLTAEPL